MEYNIGNTEPDQAVKLASYLIVRLSDAEIVKLKQQYGDEGMTSLELTRKLSSNMKSDQVLYANVEARVYRIMLDDDEYYLFKEISTK